MKSMSQKNYINSPFPIYTSITNFALENYILQFPYSSTFDINICQKNETETRHLIVRGRQGLNLDVDDNGSSNANPT